MTIATGAVVDIETTGLSPATHEIIEISIIKFLFHQDSGRVIEELGEYHAFNEPSFPLPSFIANLTGITDGMLKNKTFDLTELRTYCFDIDYFIAHNASFDRSFLIELMPELTERKWYCSMRNIKWKEYGYANKKLNTLLHGHGIHNVHAHRADSDTRSTFELLQKHNPDGSPYLLEMLSKKPMRKPQHKKTYYPKSKNVPFS
ncbi:exonuclease domain-containing protein [Heyndrickxia acidicola]|uniref:Exonuclease domain-containing protein n=1 Tax=Heyndrickxia acidicola TaxID=209389 RepID=A0ABU6MAY8_9BACI|nr:exonuclease domain-containing protein [Heyndrickxia acidicola]MED1201562.1 exonuclease domain-containing protein [Heyndrickxia acidicola]